MNRRQYEYAISKLEALGFLDVLKDWLKTKKYLQILDICSVFSLSEPYAKAAFQYLIEEDLIDSEPTYNKGHRVKIFALGFKIYLLDRNPEMVKAWKKEFYADKEIEVVLDEFSHFMNTHDVECVVSPANSWGRMDGGYDLAITEYYGNSLQEKVQRHIRDHLHGEQPVGTSIMIDIPGTKQKLIHTPTMQKPGPIKVPFLFYQCMRTTLMSAIEGKAKSLVIPAFGAGCGEAPCEVVAKYMKDAYDQIIKTL